MSTPRGQAPFLVKGTLRETTMNADGRLRLDLADVVNNGPTRPSIGDTITLRPQPVSDRMQSQERGALYQAHRANDNWLSRRGSAPTARRVVPMDVVMAAATED